MNIYPNKPVKDGAFINFSVIVENNDKTRKNLFYKVESEWSHAVCRKYGCVSSWIITLCHDVKEKIYRYMVRFPEILLETYTNIKN